MSVSNLKGLKIMIVLHTDPINVLILFVVVMVISILVKATREAF